MHEPVRRLSFSQFCSLIVALLLLLGVVTSAHAAEPAADLMELSLEALMELQVTSVSKKPQKLANAAAAVFIITQEDIRRSGATTIADALRMAPGVQVAKMSSNKWAVSIRGINGRFANKLLVLMDGRTLYNPLFSGVYWEVQDTVMEDISRIEVIRGPSASLWGANAVNGIINIITKAASETQGGLVSAGGGTDERYFATGRYGGQLGKDTSYRLYAKHQNRDSGADATGGNGGDAWWTSRGGFRLDSRLTGNDNITLQGDYYDASLGETYTLYPPSLAASPNYATTVTPRSLMSGGNLLSRWQREISDTDAFILQFYYDRSERDMIILGEKRDILDIDFQHRFRFGSMQNLVWGGGYRFSHDMLSNTEIVSFADPHERTHLLNAFIHDEITLIPDKLALILGSRFEWNSYTHVEMQPNGRLLWTPTPQNTVWGAIGRGVRTPARGDHGITYNYRTLPVGDRNNPSPLPLRLEIDGSGSFKSEELIAYEVGYRTEPLPRVTFDLAAFYNVYDGLRVLRPGTSYTEPVGGMPSNAVQPFILANSMHGHAYGAELALGWTPLDWWRLQAAYSYLKLAMSLDAPSTDETNRRDAEGDSPRHQLTLRSGFDLGRQVELDLWLRGVDRIDYIDGESLAGYATMDVRLAWKPLKGLELALVGQNLFHDRTREFAPEFINTTPTEVQRSFYGKLTWQF